MADASLRRSAVPSGGRLASLDDSLTFAGAPVQTVALSVGEDNKCETENYVDLRREQQRARSRGDEQME